MSPLVRRFVIEDAGTEAIEYGILASLLFLTILGAVTLFASNATALWSSIATHI